ncbi:CLUMA_CG004773, isoform A [Clunio marinus]|uniref:CLUMA_CG004773, isoform A n=1 Tax=Clunio marinus TaxID=568069 RepID=A0A1J1HSV7_9DIPT|nr:CLUMA_CG004773, isoform A [Clunio marinus]
MFIERISAHLFHSLFFHTQTSILSIEPLATYNVTKTQRALQKQLQHNQRKQVPHDRNLYWSHLVFIE